MYDPLLGRFLSPDNYVQLPDFTQNYNRFAYCLNNPLIYIDPTGQKSWLGKFTSWVGEGWDAMWEAGEQFAVWAEQNGLSQGGIGYNSAIGLYHYLNETGSVYHKELSGVKMAPEVVEKATNRARQMNIESSQNETDIFPKYKTDPFFEAEFSLKIGLGYEKEYYVLGMGEKLKASAAIDYITFRYDSQNGFKIIPYKDVSITAGVGVHLLSYNGTASLYHLNHNHAFQLGLSQFNTHKYPRVNLLNLSQFQNGTGYSLDVSLSFYKSANALIKVHNQYEKALGTYPRPY